MKKQRYAVSSAILVSTLMLPVGAETLDTLAEFGNAATANATSGATTPRGANFDNAAAGTYTITAGGTDFWGASDNGSFIYDADQSRAAGENFSVIVRSVSIAGDPAEGLASQWGRTGPMVRKTPDAANSATVTHIRKSGGDAAGADPADTLIQGRPSDGADTDRGPGEDGEHRNFAENTLNGSVRNTPIWLALHRYEGEWYSTWAADAGGTPGTWSDAIHRAGTPDLAGEVYVGLAHQSHEINPDINTALFEQFSVEAFNRDLGNFPVVVSCDLSLGAGGSIALTASGVELGDVTPVDIDWEVRYIGDEEVVQGVLSADIYMAGNPGSFAAIETHLANNSPSGSTQIEQIHWAAAAYTTTNAGIRVLSICVDEPGEDRQADLSQAKAFATELGYPFEVGLANAALIENLNILQRTFIGRQSDLPIPSTILIDQSGRASAVYKGPVSTKQLAKDAKVCGADSATILTHAIPYPGKWKTPPKGLLPRSVAVKMISNGLLDDARSYLLQLLPLYEDSSDQESLSEAAECQRVLGAIAHQKEEFQTAIKHYLHSL
ncbi:hypothetical protein N9230_06650, partial [Akkermansiaceae bacterium]|nr:hypothetical protein [Akkermansiaceae bacterium]